MPTAWQLLMRKLNPEKPKSSKVQNPFSAKIGSSVVFDVLDYRDMTFFVKEIKEVTRTIGTQQFQFVDYSLLARPLGKDDVLVKLRLMPVFNAQKGHVDLTHNVLLLSKYDELPFNQGLRDLLNGEDFITQQDGVETGKYWRINDVKNSYHASLKIVNEENDKNPDALFLTDGIEYWDYWREHPDESGQPVKEYLFVEMETDNGYFTIWKGEEINANRVDVR
jgi:hypothetical protein